MKISGIDLFAGAGGLSEGFIQAGFQIIGTVEKNNWACETLGTRHIYHQLKKNGFIDDYWKYCELNLSYRRIKQNRDELYKKFPDIKEIVNKTIWKAEFGDPEKENDVSSSSEIIEKLEKSIKFYNADIEFILGGPPCQVYSVVGRSRMGEKAQNDKRNYLFKYYYDVVEYFKPRFFLFENVPGIITANAGLIFNMLKEDFDRIGYDMITGPNGDIRKNIQVAQNFGVPQNRKRFIFLGLRRGEKITYPVSNELSSYGELNTKNAISDLPALLVGEGFDNGLVKYQNETRSAYQIEMRDGSRGIMNHRARPLNKWYDKKIYAMAIEKAKKNELIKYQELPKGLKKHSNEKHFQDRFKVHWWSKIPHTIVAHISKDGHYNIHPDIKQLRSLTVREAARIQSFPDNFKFEGPRTAQYVQVGNAVPPKMAKAFAINLKNQLRS